MPLEKDVSNIFIFWSNLMGKRGERRRIDISKNLGLYHTVYPVDFK